MNTKPNKTLFLAAALGVGVLLAGGSMARADPHGWGWRRPEYRHGDNEGGVNVRIDLGGGPCAVQPGGVWAPGHYVTQTQQVLIEPAHYETRWVAPVTETRYPSDGPSYTVVLRPGGYQQVQTTPPCYEIRTTEVYIPGHWECPPPVVYHECGPLFRLGAIFHF